MLFSCQGPTDRPAIACCLVGREGPLDRWPVATRGLTTPLSCTPLERAYPFPWAHHELQVTCPEPTQGLFRTVTGISASLSHTGSVISCYGHGA